LLLPGRDRVDVAEHLLALEEGDLRELLRRELPGIHDALDVHRLPLETERQTHAQGVGEPLDAADLPGRLAVVVFDPAEEDGFAVEDDVARAGVAVAGLADR